MNFFAQAIADFRKSFTPPNLPVDEQRKRGFLALFLLTIIPLLLGFGTINVLEKGISAEILLIGAGILMAVVNVFALIYLKNLLPLFRSGVLLAIGLLTFEIVNGHGRGVAFLWFYFHPVAAFFIFGTQEGLFWVFLSWFINLLVLHFNWGLYHYESAVSIRFMVTYTLVSVLAYGLEASRNRYYTQLLAEKAALEVALQQVKTLQGLLPICASCKKIRDDAGYWHQVESYIGRHAAVEFSHSICPDCRTKLYTEIEQKNRTGSAPVPPPAPQG